MIFFLIIFPQDAFSLLAYSDPWSSPVGNQLDPIQREPVCSVLNSAILGKASWFACLVPLCLLLKNGSVAAHPASCAGFSTGLLAEGPVRGGSAIMLCWQNRVLGGVSATNIIPVWLVPSKNVFF